MSRPNRHLARGNEGHGASQPSLSAPAPGSPATTISGPCCARGESVAGAAGGPATGTTTASMLDRWPTGAASTVRSTQWAETGDDPCPERGRDCPSVAPAAVSIPPLLLAEGKPGDHRWPVRSPRSLRRRCAGHARRSSRADALVGSAPSLGRRSCARPCAWSAARATPGTRLISGCVPPTPIWTGTRSPPPTLTETRSLPTSRSRGSGSSAVSAAAPTCSSPTWCSSARTCRGPGCSGASICSMARPVCSCSGPRSR